MPRSPKVDQAETAVLDRACLMATYNPIFGTDQDAVVLMFQAKENVRAFAPPNCGEGKYHDRSSNGTKNAKNKFLNLIRNNNLVHFVVNGVTFF